ncbi:MAG: protein kinase [Deltaproteobacteria bacterium]|nr:protein kinase [Deltaproteobacteria bacterium]MDQ3295889.1 serine/threonine protein kinase [Myxococcota bacterium]
MPACTACTAEILDIDVRCGTCGAVNGSTGAHRMLGQDMLGVYKLVDVLGQGGMSVVFKGKHKLTEQEVALKILPPELAAHSQVKSRFLDEAKALAALDHPNIVHLYNFGEENGFFVLAMQLVQGQTWERMILEAKRLDWKTSTRLTIDVLRALEYAHDRGVIHRDMKPSNVLVRAHDSSATVMDFGIAKMTTSTRLTATGQTMGTVRYMSPEQVRGQEVDLRTDLYSLGATFYESLTGDTPFDGSTHFEIMTKHLSELPKPPSAVGVEVPRQLEDALMRCLAKKPEDRFANAREMRKLLEATLRQEDAGLNDTQRLDRKGVADVKLPPTSPSAKKVVAAATELADKLEPPTVSPTAVTAARKSRLPWIALAVLVLGGATTAGVLLLAQENEDGYRSTTAVPDVKLTAGQRFADLGILVETDGEVTPGEVADSYRETLAALEAFDDTGAIRAVVKTVVAVPQRVLCDRNIARTSREPCVASDVATTALGNGGSHLLLISDDRATLPATMRKALAQAVCDFQPAYLDVANQNGRAKLESICKMTQRFIAAGSPRK